MTALLGSACLLACAPERAVEGPSILLVVLDTVRADRLSCYGYSRRTTPALDALAAGGVRFEKFYSSSGWTLPAHASLFTGLYPASHGATQEKLHLAEDIPTLAETLAAAGYRTFGSSANPFVSRRTGLARGFDTFVESFRRDVRRDPRPGHPNSRAFSDFLQESGDAPYFAFLNYIEAHLPYAPPEPHRSRFLADHWTAEEVAAAEKLNSKQHYMDGPLPARQMEILGALYDAEIAALDEVMADLLQRVRDDRRETVIVVTSDHGEHLGEHGHLGHVFSIRNTLLHVPLLVAFPDGAHAGEVRREPAEMIDLFSTLLRLAGVGSDISGPTGRSAGRDLFAGPAARAERAVMAEYYYPQQVLALFGADASERFRPYMRRMRTLQDGRSKFVWGSDGKHEMFDLEADPGEARNLLATVPGGRALSQARAAGEALETRVAEATRLRPLPPVPAAGTVPAEIETGRDDPELRQRLRSLGYVR